MQILNLTSIYSINHTVHHACMRSINPSISSIDRFMEIIKTYRDMINSHRYYHMTNLKAKMTKQYALDDILTGLLVVLGRSNVLPSTYTKLQAMLLAAKIFFFTNSLSSKLILSIFSAASFPDLAEIVFSMFVSPLALVLFFWCLTFGKYEVISIWLRIGLESFGFLIFCGSFKLFESFCIDALFCTGMIIFGGRDSDNFAWLEFVDFLARHIRYVAN